MLGVVCLQGHACGTALAALARMAGGEQSRPGVGEDVEPLPLSLLVGMQIGASALESSLAASGTRIKPTPIRPDRVTMACAQEKRPVPDCSMQLYSNWPKVEASPRPTGQTGVSPRREVFGSEAGTYGVGESQRKQAE